MGDSTEDRDDEALFVAWRGGDPSAGDVLAVRHCGDILRFFNNKVPEAAEDLMQQTFVACMSTNIDAAEVRSFRAFLFGVARKRLLQHFEKRGQLRGEEMMSRISLAELRTTPTQRIAAEQDKALIHQAMAQMPLDQQILLELYYWQKLSVAEVAAALGGSEGGIRGKLHRARQRLRGEYDEVSRGKPLVGFDGDP